MKRASVRTYLMVVVMVATVPLVASAIYDVVEDLRTTEQHTRESLRTLASAMVTNTTAKLVTGQRGLATMTHRHLAESLAPPACEASFAEFIASCSYCLDLFTTDAQGQLACASRLQSGAQRQGSVAQAPWYPGAGGGFTVSPPWDDPFTGERVTVLSQPLVGTGGAPRGAVHVTFRLDALDPRIPTEFLPQDARFGFFDPRGVVVWRDQDPEHLIGRKNPALARFLGAQLRDGEFEAPGLDGVTRLHATRPMPLTGWVAVIGVPARWVRSVPYSHALATARVVFIAVLALMAIALLAARRIAAPIIELERVARAAQQGDVDVVARSDGPRELAAVAEALNALLAARKQSERELRAFLENSAVIAWMKDDKGRHRFVTQNLLKRFGLTEAAMLGKTDAEIWPADLVETFRDPSQEALAASGGFDVVQHLPNGDGTVSTWLTHKFPFQLANGQRCVGGLAVEITAVERAEAAQRLTDAQLNQAFGASPIGMALITVEGRFIRVNKAFAEMLGYSEDELLKTGPAAITSPLDRERDVTRIDDLIAGRRARYQTEKRYLHKDGHEVWAQLNVTVVKDAHGKPLHCLSQIQDISERKAAETSARLAVVGTLAAGAAHEINNPLTYVLGNLSWVQDELEELLPSLPPAQAAQLKGSLEALVEAHGGAQRIATIVAGLKTFSRKSEQTVAPTDVVKLMESALRLTNAHRRNQAATVTRFGQAPLVMASAQQLEQVFINLLVNAAQAIPEGRADEHRITVVVDGNAQGEAFVEVQDTGVGITDEVMPHLFEPFFTTKPVGRGTGLGLPTCHGIVTSFGGRIEVESVPGKGSTFRVLLPGLPPDTGTPITPLPQQVVALPAGGRVLVIDDEAAVARSIARALRGGPEVVTLTDPREALQRIEGGERYDLIVCDLMMPTLSGEEFQRQLLALRPALAESMLFLTGGAFTQGSSTFLASTRNRYLQKPADTNELRRAVAEGLQTSPAAS